MEEEEISAYTSSREEAENWDNVFRQHEKEWKQTDATIINKEEKMLQLKEQLGMYEKYKKLEKIQGDKFQEEEEKIFQGIGNANAKVVLLHMNPGLADVQTKEALSATYNNYFVNQAKMYGVDVKSDQFYHLYIFPFYMKEKTLDVVNQEYCVFLPYALRAILIIRPKYIVAFGKQALKVAIGAFSLTRMRFLQIDKYLKPQGQIINYTRKDLDCRVIFSHHPWTLAGQQPMQGKEDNAALLEENRKYNKEMLANLFLLLSESKKNQDAFQILQKSAEINEEEMIGEKKRPQSSLTALNLENAAKKCNKMKDFFDTTTTKQYYVEPQKPKPTAFDVLMGKAKIKKKKKKKQKRSG